MQLNAGIPFKSGIGDKILAVYITDRRIGVKTGQDRIIYFGHFFFLGKKNWAGQKAGPFYKDYSLTPPIETPEMMKRDMKQ